MSAQVIQIRDYQNKRDLERMAIEVMNQCFPSWPGGIDDLVPVRGFWAGLTDEQKALALAYDGPENHGDPAFYRAPDKDPA